MYLMFLSRWRLIGSTFFSNVIGLATVVLSLLSPGVLGFLEYSLLCVVRFWYEIIVTRLQ